MSKSDDCIGRDELERKVLELETEIARLERKVECECRGRITAEKALRTRFIERAQSVGYFPNMRPIGTVESCFPTRFGTPRQALLADKTRGRIQLDKTVVGYTSLSHLEQYSHIWIFTIFHENTNIHRQAADASRPLQQHCFPSFVKPPQGGGDKKGLFSTRTPHRPNPLAMSLVKIRSINIDKGLIEFYGVDLVNNTPVLDIKPYLPHIDNPINSNTYQIPLTDDIFAPNWLTDENFVPVNVHFTDQALEQFTTIVSEGQLEWYKSNEIEEAKAAVEQVLSLDPRGVIHGRGNYSSPRASQSNNNLFNSDMKRENSKQHECERRHRTNFAVRFDNIDIKFSPSQNGERSILITHVELYQAEVLDKT